MVQVLIGNALQSSFPPNTSTVSVTMERQISNDTVVVTSAFVVWQSMIPILLANKCCALEVLYLQHAVERVMPDAIGAPHYFCVSCQWHGTEIGSVIAATDPKVGGRVQLMSLPWLLTWQSARMLQSNSHDLQ